MLNHALSSDLPQAKRHDFRPSGGRVSRWRRSYGHGRRDQLCANCRVLIALFRRRHASTLAFDSIQPPLTRDSLEFADSAVDKRDLPSDQKISDRTRDHDLVWTRLRRDPRADMDGDSDCIPADQFAFASVNAGSHLQPELLHSL